MSQQATGFDIAGFLSTVYKQQGSTTMPKVPQGEYYADILPFTSDSAMGWTDPDDEGKKQLKFTVNYAIDDDKVRAITHMSKPRVRQMLFLDFAKDGKTLDFTEGSNVRLGRLREAVGQNTAAAWSLANLQGKRVKVTIVHADNPKDPNDPYVNISKVEKV